MEAPVELPHVIMVHPLGEEDDSVAYGPVDYDTGVAAMEAMARIDEGVWLVPIIGGVPDLLAHYPL